MIARLLRFAALRLGWCLRCRYRVRAHRVPDNATLVMRDGSGNTYEAGAEAPAVECRRCRKRWWR